MDEEERYAIIVELPIPPSDNRRLTIRHIPGRPCRFWMILTQETRKFFQDVYDIFDKIWPQSTILVPSIHHQLHIQTKVYLPSWRGDTSNFTKVLKDSLEGIVYDSDKFVHILYDDSEVDRENPRVRLTIPVDPVTVAKPNASTLRKIASRLHR